MANMGQQQHHCSVTAHLPGICRDNSTGELSQSCCSEIFHSPDKHEKWAGSTLHQNWHHHCQCLALHSSPRDEFNCCSRCTKAEISATEQWVNTQTRNGLTKREVAMSFQKYLFQKSPSWVLYNSHPSRTAQYPTILFSCFPESAG